jgi:hypothetical protein
MSTVPTLGLSDWLCGRPDHARSKPQFRVARSPFAVTCDKVLNVKAYSVLWAKEALF